MEQHPIPQNISSYQFKLVGDMTLKQFFQVAGGVLAGLIFYSSPLLAIIKYPIALICVLLGIGLAFLPFEERPLEKWIFAFFRAIYSPTIFKWKKGAISDKLFLEETAVQPITQQDIALKDYLDKNNHQQTAPAILDKAEGNFLSNLLGIFKNTNTIQTANSAVTPNVTPVQPIQPPTLTPTPTPVVQATPIPQPVQTLEPLVSQPAATPVPTISEPLPTYQNTITTIKIPQNIPTAINQSSDKQPIQNGSLYATPNPAVSVPVAPPMSGTNIVSTTQALFSVDAAPPNPPTYPNVVVGQVIDQDRRIIEGVIMEIRDSSGRPIRALRSNRAGHFITVTKLDNGHYEIITEKDGYEFGIVSFDAIGEIIPPILVQGKRLSPFLEMPAVPVKPKYSIN